MTFEYNDAGLRTSKTVNGVTTEYFYSGSLLIAQQTGDEILMFFYDESGSPLGFQYRNGTYASGVFDEYIYEKNLQGDIVAIYNNVGTMLVSYSYEAWGNVNKGYYNGGSNTGASKNPLTYRGYYHDQDLGLYYLQSRYYDSLVGRFINADEIGFLGANGDLNSYNLYAYCSNNPVMYTDPSGNVVISIGWILVLTVAALLTVYDICQFANKDEGEKIEIEKNETNDTIQVKNSYKIFTPWVMGIYGTYLNHFNPKTKDIIQGTTMGFVFEWRMHNYAAWVKIGGNSARNLDVGKSIFSDGDTHPLTVEGKITSTGVMSTAMRAMYIGLFFQHGFWIKDAIVNGGFGN